MSSSGERETHSLFPVEEAGSRYASDIGSDDFEDPELAGDGGVPGGLAESDAASARELQLKIERVKLQRLLLEEEAKSEIARMELQYKKLHAKTKLLKAQNEERDLAKGLKDPLRTLGGGKWPPLADLERMEAELERTFPPVEGRRAELLVEPKTRASTDSKRPEIMGAASGSFPGERGIGAAGFGDPDARSVSNASAAAVEVNKYASAVEAYMQEQQEGSSDLLSAENIRLEALQVIKIPEQTQKLRSKLLDGSYKNPLNFKLGDPKHNDIEHIILVRRGLLDIAEVTGLRFYVSSLSPTLCATAAEYERASKVMEAVVSLTKESETRALANAYCQVAARLTLTALKIMITSSTDGVLNVYGNAIDGVNANKTDHERLQALLQAMDQQCAKKATIHAGYRAHGKLYGMVQKEPKLGAGGIERWLDEIERLESHYVLMPTRLLPVDYFILYFFIIYTLANCKRMPLTILGAIGEKYRSLPQTLAARWHFIERPEFKTLLNELRAIYSRRGG